MAFYAAETDTIYSLTVGGEAPFAEQFRIHRIASDDFQVRDRAERIAWAIWYSPLRMTWTANHTRGRKESLIANTLAEILDSIRNVTNTNAVKVG